ncbi:MAG: hypothetical protein K2O08_03365, partial [Clostridia bacterium]|nr:hypothetical protein [Clostridia bacterium]
MEYANLIPIENMTGCPFPFFNETTLPTETYYKVYNDGGHYIATRICRSQAKSKSQNNAQREDIDI